MSAATQRLLKKDMDGYDDAERDAEDTDKLLYGDIDSITSVFGLDYRPSKVDFCDLLLDAIDAQLDQLQVQLPKGDVIFRQSDCSNAENIVDYRYSPITHKDPNKTLYRKTSDKEETECRKEQVTWRLKRLLGDISKQGKISGETRSLSESICTEDFVRRFKEEMVEVSLSDSMQHLGREEKADMTDSDTYLSDRDRTGLEGHGSKRPGQGKRHKKVPSENSEVNISQLIKKREAEDGGKTPQSSRGVSSEGQHFLLQCVTDINDHCNNQPDSDTLTQAANKPPSTGVRNSSHGYLHYRSLSACKGLHNKRETYSDKKDTAEEIDRSVISVPVRTSEKIWSDWTSMKKQHGNHKRSILVMSVLEREEIERQLDSAKKELFTEQRRAREKIESLEEKLEESHEELDRCTETERSLRNRCVCLEEKQIWKIKWTEALEVQLNELQHELRECKIRMGITDKTLAQKELQLLDLQEQCGMLQAEKGELKRELEHLKSQYSKELKEGQEQSHTLMVNKETEEENTSTEHEEKQVIEIQKVLKQEREAAENCKVELPVEVLEMVRKAVEKKRKCEAEKLEDIHMHCGILEDQLESLTSEMEREKSKSLTLQLQVEELKTQSQKMVLRLKQDVQLAVREIGKLQVMLEEREMSHKLFRAETEEQLRHWTKQLRAECQHLRLLVEQSGSKQRDGELPQSLTVTETVLHLRTLRMQLTDLISHLQQELDSRKQIHEQLTRDKEQELCIQKQQLRVEREQALNSVKERLIQEHIEELSSLKWVHARDGGEGRVASSLRRQLRAKDVELRQVQSSMAQWKQQTAAHLACMFEEELTAELERCKARFIRDRKLSKIQEVRHKEEMTLGAKETQKSICSPFLHGGDYAPTSIPSDIAPFKLLCYLQSRVKQLRVEKQAFMQSLTPPEKIPLDLLGSYLTEDQGGAGNHSQSLTHAVSSDGHEISHSVNKSTPVTGCP